MTSNYLSIESSKRKSGNSNNFVIDAVINNAKSFAVRSISFCNNIYLINNNTNRIPLSVGTQSYVATLVNGNYSAQNLAAHIQAQLNAIPLIGGGFVVSYQPVINKFSFTYNTAWTLDWQLEPNQNLYQMLGFDQKQYPGYIATNYQIQAPYQCNLNPLVYVDIVSNQLGKRLKNTNLNMNAIERLFVSNLQYGENIVFEPKYRRIFEFNPDMSISQIDIQLVDNYGRLIQIDNNIDIVILLECFYV